MEYVYLTYCLCNDAVSGSEYTAWNGWVMEEYCIDECAKGSRRGLIGGTTIDIAGGTEKIEELRQ